jgi:hypothetical protein
MARQVIRQIGKNTQTVGAQYSDPGGNDCFVPGWDRKPGGEQAMGRVKQRVRMGRKLTPKGPGVLRPTRR